MELDINQIKEILPHRYPFLLIDRILECEPGKMARARKNVTINEPFFQGHFPGKPVMPGVLLIEAMAQTGAVAILSLEENKGKIGFMGAVNNAKFKKQIVPGDTLDIEVEIIKCKGPIGVGRGTVTVDGKTAAAAELTFAIGQ